MHVPRRQCTMPTACSCIVFIVFVCRYSPCAIAVVPDGFTHWDVLAHPEDDGKLTAEALRAYVSAQYKLNAALILIDIPSKEKGKAGEGKILYNHDMKSHRDTKAKVPLRDLYTAAGFALHEGRDHFDVNLACEDEEGAEVITPRFRVRV